MRSIDPTSWKAVVLYGLAFVALEVVVVLVAALVLKL